MAQFGRALRSGRRGRVFESRHPEEEPSRRRSDREWFRRTAAERSEGAIPCRRNHRDDNLKEIDYGRKEIS